jgi:NAD dependent epimerase/dehydratase family
MVATNIVAKEYYESSKLAKFPFEPYWPDAKLRICVTGAGGFIASHLAKRLKSEGHYIIGCDWKRNEHMPVRVCSCEALFTMLSVEEKVPRLRMCYLSVPTFGLSSPVPTAVTDVVVLIYSYPGVVC